MPLTIIKTIAHEQEVQKSTTFGTPGSIELITAYIFGILRSKAID
jgi:hypothetical protein